jgi:hypothetical protein
MGVPHVYNGYGWAPQYSGMMMALLPAAYSAAAPSSIQPSSDPPDAAAANLYPLITDFLGTLQLQHPHRNLQAIIPNFCFNDYFHIDELASFSKEDLMGVEFGMTGGNARFLLDQIDDEMRHFERASGLKRKRARVRA